MSKFRSARHKLTSESREADDDDDEMRESNEVLIALLGAAGLVLVAQGGPRGSEPEIYLMPLFLCTLIVDTNTMKLGYIIAIVQQCHNIRLPLNVKRANQTSVMLE